MGQTSSSGLFCMLVRLGGRIWEVQRLECGGGGLGTTLTSIILLMLHLLFIINLSVFLLLCSDTDPQCGIWFCCFWPFRCFSLTSNTTLASMLHQKGHAGLQSLPGMFCSRFADSPAESILCLVYCS